MTPRHLAFPVTEYRARLQKVEGATEAAGLDALLTTILGNICWLTGFQTLASYSFALYATLVRPGSAPVLGAARPPCVNCVPDGRAYDPLRPCRP